jgi:hypothetical protein
MTTKKRRALRTKPPRKKRAKTERKRPKKATPKKAMLKKAMLKKAMLKRAMLTRVTPKLMKARPTKVSRKQRRFQQTKPNPRTVVVTRAALIPMREMPARAVLMTALVKKVPRRIALQRSEIAAMRRRLKTLPR